MNASSSTLQKTLALVATLRTSRTSGRGWDGQVDRDLVRATNDVYYLAQSSAPRVI